MTEHELQRELADAQEAIRSLQKELAETNRGLVALTLELEQRVDERTAQLCAAQEELKITNSELLQLTLGLEQRVATRTVELQAALDAHKRAEREIQMLNEALERRVIERTAQLEAANKELEAFSYSVSHDLRAPLRSMEGFSQALLEDYGDRLDATAKNYLERVQSAGQRLARLIDDLLNLSRVTRSEMQWRPIDLSKLAHTIVGDLRKADPHRHVEIAIQDGMTVNGDPRLIRSMMENLLGNAWKYTSKHAHAKIEFGTIRYPDGTLVHFVRDDGAGFDMAYADKLFGAFQRLHKTKEFSGTGIGLATVQRIVHRHGGRVWGEGAIEKGATFSFTLG
jgi:light-regulated signal transduction histidine kinase (bacteriophytochrome)